MIKGCMVVTYDVPDDIDENVQQLVDIKDALAEHFRDKPGIQIYVAIREKADEVIDVLTPAS